MRATVKYSNTECIRVDLCELPTSYITHGFTMASTADRRCYDARLRYEEPEPVGLGLQFDPEDAVSLLIPHPLSFVHVAH